MGKGKPRAKKSADIKRILEDSKKLIENQAHAKRLIEEAKKTIDTVFWEYPLSFEVNGMFGKLVCVYDQTRTVETIIEMLEGLDNPKHKVDRDSYTYRASTLINFIFSRKMRHALEELAWEISELLMLENIFEDLSAYEAMAGRQRISPRLLKTSKLVADKLRVERWTATMGRGMRGKDSKPRKSKSNTVPAHEINRQKVLSAIKRVRSMSDEEQDRMLNNKTLLAREAGISYHTLWRAENQGGWTVESLIVELSKKTKRAR